MLEVNLLLGLLSVQLPFGVYLKDRTFLLPAFKLLWREALVDEGTEIRTIEPHLVVLLVQRPQHQLERVLDLCGLCSDCCLLTVAQKSLLKWLEPQFMHLTSV